MTGRELRRLVLVVAAVAAALVLLDVVLLAFAGVLVAVFLRGIADPLARRTGMPGGAAVAIVVLALALALGGVGWWAADDVAKEADALIAAAPELAADATASLREYGWGRWILDHGDDATTWLSDSGAVRRATRMVGSGVGLVGSMFVILVLGIFLAAEPRVYERGALRLVPGAHRPCARAILADAGGALRMWLLAKVIAMVAIFAATWIGLSLLGVPLALILALVAGLLTFIPNFGPVLSAIPAVLLALPEGLTTVLGVIGLYVGVQVIESNFLSPLIERKAIALPPALTLVGQAALALLAGPLGLFVATPLVAVALTAGRHLTEPLEEP